MNIFSRRANVISSEDIGKFECDVTAKTLRNSGKDSDSLVEFLTERQLMAVDDTCSVEQARKRIEESGIVSMMLETCNLINKMVGRTIVDVHSFLPPIPILRCFIYVEDGTEYFMRLELQGVVPTLTFAERNCRDGVANDFLRWAQRLANIEPVTINIKAVHEFENVYVSVGQIREWFKYLVSGLDRSHMPSFE
jgi:hypothetical protein